MEMRDFLILVLVTGCIFLTKLEAQVFNGKFKIVWDYPINKVHPDFVEGETYDIIPPISTLSTNR